MKAGAEKAILAKVEQQKKDKQSKGKGKKRPAPGSDMTAAALKKNESQTR